MGVELNTKSNILWTQTGGVPNPANTASHQVSQTLADLDNTISMLYSELANLEAALEPVLFPNKGQPEVQSQKAQAPMSPRIMRSEVTERLNDFQQRVAHMRVMVLQILERLEV